MNSKKDQRREKRRNSGNTKDLDLSISQKYVFNSKNLRAKPTNRPRSSLNSQNHGNKKLTTEYQSSPLNYKHYKTIQYNSFG